MTILSYCRINNKHLLYNGQELMINQSSNAYINEMYRFLQVDYPKFFKMDNLSKIGFIGAELLLNKNFKANKPHKNMAIVCCNSTASLDNDRRYQNTIVSENFYPSPAIFVYTLPNIVTGEIAIRHQIMGETSFFVTKSFSAEFIFNTAKSAFQDKNIDYCLSAWIDYEFDNADMLMILFSKNETENNCNIENISKLYTE